MIAAFCFRAIDLLLLLDRRYTENPVCKMNVAVFASSSLLPYSLVCNWTAVGHTFVLAVCRSGHLCSICSAEYWKCNWTSPTRSHCRQQIPMASPERTHMQKHVKKLFLLSQLQHIINIDTGKLFYNAHIQPHIDYASVVWDGYG